MDRGGERQSHGSWAPDGSALAYTRWPLDSLMPPEVYLHTFGTGKSVRLGPGLGPVWAPEGGGIAFLQPAEEGRFHVMFHEEGTTAQWSTEALAIRHLAWSPDGQQLMYELPQPEFERVRLGFFEVNGQPWSLDLSGGPAFSTWHPNGNLLAFARYLPRTGWDLHVYDPLSHHEQPLLQSLWQESHPAFSPDGGRLAFVSDRSGLPAIWLYDLITQKLRPLTDGKAFPLHPEYRQLSWDPEGRQLLYTGLRDNQETQLMVVGVE